jgi:hypothetical protein
LATIPTFARSVPNEARDWCIDKLRASTKSAALLDLQEAIKRLVDPIREITIWRRMAKVKRSFPAFDPTNVCMDAVTAAADWQRNLKAQKAATAKANKRLNALLGEAVTLIPKISIDTPLMMRNAILWEDDPLKHQVYEAEIQDKGLDQYLPHTIHIVQAVHAALQAVPVRHANQPFKTGAANAERTSLIMRLSANFIRQTGSVPFELVAEIVNVTMNRTDTTTDTVRKAQ